MPRPWAWSLGVALSALLKISLHGRGIYIIIERSAQNKLCIARPFGRVSYADFSTTGTV